VKNIVIMGSGNGSNFEAIVKYFSAKELKIECLSDVQDSYIFKRAEKFGINYKFLPFEKNLEYFSKNKFDLIVLAGYMRILPEEVLKNMGKVINIHPSLLPAFKGKDALKRAFISGVKVSGVTVHYVDCSLDGGKIIAQYPVFIDNLTHFDEFESKIHTLEHKLYPIVIEKILEDSVFDFSEFIKSGCHNNEKAGGCWGCKTN
jgi:phosphoribosylglycinamide formyltransferase-1